MVNFNDIMETITMIQDENLDIRTITMGISLLDCADSDIDRSCQKVYDKITTKAARLVAVGESIEKKYGIPIVNKRISVTPIAMLVAASGGDPVKYALALDKAAHQVGVDFKMCIRDSPYGVPIIEHRLHASGIGNGRDIIGVKARGQVIGQRGIWHLRRIHRNRMRCSDSLCADLEASAQLFRRLGQNSVFCRSESPVFTDHDDPAAALQELSH